MKHMTLKQLYKQMPKFEVKPLRKEEINSFINQAMEIWFRRCIVCKKDFKNYHGMAIHRARKHKLSLYGVNIYADPSVPLGAIRVRWDKANESK